MSEGNVSHLPERRDPDASPALPAVTAPPSPAEWLAMREQAQVIHRSGMAPKSIRNAEQVLVIALKGRELRLPPMQALSHIHVVEGKPTLSAELMAALVQRAGHKLRVIETSSEKCVVEGERADDPRHPQRVTWTMQDARTAGVANKGPWKSYPAAMLRARAISALCRFAFADVLMGASYTPEELGAEVDEEGRVVDAEATSEPVVEREPEPSEAIEEAEVVEEGPVEDEDQDAHQSVLTEISVLYGSLPPEVRPDNWDAVRAYAEESWEKAVAVKKRLQRKAEEAEPVPHPDEVEGVDRGGAADPGNLPATRKQLNYLEALAAEIDDRGVAGLEEMLGKPLGECTREEASEWIGRLSGREV